SNCSAINSAFIDPQSFEIAHFEPGDYISITWSTNTIYARIFPLISTFPAEIRLNKIFVNSFNVSPDTLVSISEAPNFSLAGTLTISSNIEETALLSQIDQIKSCLGKFYVPHSQMIPYFLSHFSILFREIVPANDEMNQNVSLDQLPDLSVLYISADSKKICLPNTINQHFIIKSKSIQIKLFKENTIGLFDESVSIPHSFNPDLIQGVDKYIHILKKRIYYPISNKKLYHDIGVLRSKGMVIHGIAGIGKKSIVYKFCKTHALTLFSLDCAELRIEPNHFDNIIKKYNPDIILLKHFDAVFDSVNPDFFKIDFIDNFKTFLKNIQNSAYFIVTCYHVNKIMEFRSAKLFDFDIEILLPDSLQRTHIINSLLTQYKHNMTIDEIMNVVKHTHGFIPVDLKNLVRESGNCACARILNDPLSQNSSITYDDFASPLVSIKPSIIRDMLVHVPDTSWADIGGMESVKASVKECLEWPWKYPEAFKRMSISPPSGLLLYGPPGCSKTMIARAISNESGLNFISIKGPELVNMYVGETERSIRNLFNKARCAAPCIIFFDELDSFTSKDFSNYKTKCGVDNRILGQLMTEIDGISTQHGQVFVIGATNKPFSLDPALIRCGRFDRLIYVPLPDATSRKEIFKLKFLKMPVDSSMDIDLLVSKTHNFSGAEIVAVCQKAAITSLGEDPTST
ncbi:hypothetical protein MXB_3925, partial [Myxobolus squamalis]